jgi:hypothetical protein
VPQVYSLPMPENAGAVARIRQFGPLRFPNSSTFNKSRDP